MLIYRLDMRWIAIAAVAIFCQPIVAGGLQLDYGFRLEGQPLKRTAITLDLVKRPDTGRTVYSLMTVEDGVRRYHMPYRLADRDSIDETVGIGLERFEFDVRDPISDAEPGSIGVVDQTLPFASRGGREVVIRTSSGPRTVLQQVASLTSERVEIVSRELLWEYGLLTAELDDKSLMQILNAATNPASLPDLLSRVSFLVQADRFDLAQHEMSLLKEKFPEAADRAVAFEEKLNELFGQKAMREVEIRRAAGQHQLALGYSKSIRDNELVSFATADRADLVVQEYEALLKKRDDVIYHLGILEGELTEEQAVQVRPLRPQLVAELHADTIGRLDSFLDSVDDVGLTAAEKLALAYSAWVGGPANGTTNLEDAVDDWALRAAVLDYVRAPNKYERAPRWEAISVIEGVTIQDLEAMIPLLPSIDPPADLVTDVPIQLETQSGVSYDVQLPPEYSHARAYPVLIALHAGAGFKTTDELRWWAGTAEQPDFGRKRGYIVVAPDYLGDAEQPSGLTHDRIVDVLVDLRRRFRVDSDRVFLVGHALGADVVWDMGLARPMLWAGIVPIGGKLSDAAKRSWPNGVYTAIYAVNGGLDGRTFTANAPAIQQIMEEKSDVLLCEYVGRGVEPYGAEKPRIFEWMTYHKRPPVPREIEAKVFHPGDTDWTWYHPVALLDPPKGSEPPVQIISAKVTPGNTVYVGRQRARLLLSPALVDFDERIRIKKDGSRSGGTHLLQPSMRTMLDDFVDRFDRERLFWAELTVP